MSNANSNPVPATPGTSLFDPKNIPAAALAATKLSPLCAAVVEAFALKKGDAKSRDQVVAWIMAAHAAEAVPMLKSFADVNDLRTRAERSAGIVLGVATTV
jgi:hypothetical protein